MLSLLLAASALAVDITVDVTLPQEAEQAGLDADALGAELTRAIGDELRVADFGAYMDQMADANVLSAKGMGVDYGSDMQRFAFGGAFGTAVNGAGALLDGGTAKGLPETGFALQIGAMAGVNLGVLSGPDSVLRRVKLYVNGMSARTDRSPFTATFLNYGAHAQIKLVKGGDKTDGVRWGGLDVTGGYEHSAYVLELNEALPVEADVLSWDATGTYRLSAEATSVPVEVSTNLHVFVATAFGGVAYDHNLSGGATSTVEVRGPVRFAYQGRVQDVGSASVTVRETGAVSPSAVRAFVGLQADVLFVKLYGQLNVTTDRSVGGHVGVRAVM
jgi:hypothetical protein